MARYKPKKCPECGSFAISKEIVRGIRTGDWVCAECGDSGPLSDEPWPDDTPKDNTEKKT
jgi:ribosomal protein L37AE/L43A